MTRRIDPARLPNVAGSYPPPFDAPCRARSRLALADAAGLTQLDVNLLHLPPGAWSSQRHWESAVDEFVCVLAGEVVLVTDAGEETLRAGDTAGFRAGDPDGHHLQNRSTADATVLEIGARLPGNATHYADIDLHAPADGKPAAFTRKDGTPYP